jgi:hypothetical protein
MGVVEFVSAKPAIAKDVVDLLQILSERSAPIHLIAIDGTTGAGKSFLRNQLARALCAHELEFDEYLIRDREEFVRALKMKDLANALTQLQTPVVASGVCMLKVLQQLQIEPDVLVYVKRMAIWGWADHDEVEGDEIEELAAHIGLSTDDLQLHLEVRQYHRDFRPQHTADVIFERLEVT